MMCPPVVSVLFLILMVCQYQKSTNYVSYYQITYKIGFLKNLSSLVLRAFLHELRPTDGVATCVFIAACYISNQTFKQLAKLRRNRFGNVDSENGSTYRLLAAVTSSNVHIAMYISPVVAQPSCAIIIVHTICTPGHVTSTSYKLPTGTMFSLVSCPHYLAEIMVYGSIAAIVGCQSKTWLCLTGYVCATQLYLAHSTHAWYQRKFEDMPKNRKRIIPYIF